MHKLICVLLFGVVIGVCVGQSPEPQTTATQATERQISAEAWSKATEGLDYSKDVPRAKKEEEQKSKKNKSNLPDFSNIGKGIQVFLVVVGLLLIGFVLYRITQQKFDKTIASDGVEITTENIENYLDEVDIDGFLQKSIEEKKYNLAIRLYYLKSIKLLDTKGKVKWEKQKTNRDYLRETRSLSLAPLFKSLTSIYEQTWYGAKVVNQDSFEEVETDFKLFISQI